MSGHEARRRRGQVWRTETSEHSQASAFRVAVEHQVLNAELAVADAVKELFTTAGDVDDVREAIEQLQRQLDLFEALDAVMDTDG